MNGHVDPGGVGHPPRAEATTTAEEDHAPDGPVWRISLTQARFLARLSTVELATRWRTSSAHVVWVEKSAPSSPAIDYLHALGARDVHLAATIGGRRVRVEVSPPPSLLVVGTQNDHEPARVRAARIRRWAVSRGLEVRARGPIPRDVAVAYDRAHHGEPPGPDLTHPGRRPVDDLRAP